MPHVRARDPLFASLSREGLEGLAQEYDQVLTIVRADCQGCPRDGPQNQGVGLSLNFNAPFLYRSYIGRYHRPQGVERGLDQSPIAVHRRTVTDSPFYDRYREQQAMSCKSCGSENLGKFRGEIAIQSFWLENPDETPVFVWPELAVCLDCGVARFAVPARDMRVLAAKATAAAAA